MNKTPRKIAKLILSTIVPTVLMSSFDVNAAPGILQNIPFAAISASVQPNILFLLDDSGSMNWEVVRVDGVDTAWYIDLTPEPDDLADQLFSCAGFNTLAYNQDVTYTPWKGKDADGVSFTDQDPAAARLNPHNTSTEFRTDTDGFATQFDPLYGVINLLTLEDADGNVAGYQPWFDDGDGIYETTNEEDGNFYFSDPFDQPGDECKDTADSFVKLTDLNAQQRVNYANWYSYYRSRAYSAKNGLLSVIDQSRARVGVAGLSGNRGADGIVIRDVDDVRLSDGTLEGNARRDAAIANKFALMQSVASTESNGGTPLKETLALAGEYFREDGTVTDDFFGASASYNIATDKTISVNSPILNADNGGTCQSNYTVLFTDGFASGDTFQTQADIGNADGGNGGSGDTAWDGGNFADEISGTLADVAMRYLERDLAPNLTDNTNIKDIRRPGEFINHQHMTTYTIGFGVDGDLDANPPLPDPDDSGSLSFDWPDARDGGRASIDDMRHAAWNGRGSFLSSSDPQQLITDINNVFIDINERSQSTTAASSVNSDFIKKNTLVFMTQFDSDDWTGNLFTYRFDDVGNVDIANPIFNVQDVLSTRVLANNGITGTPAAPVNASGYTNSRYIITKRIDTADTTSLQTGPGIGFIFDELSATQKNIFTGAMSSFSDWDGTDADVFGEALVGFIKGDSTHELGNNGEAEPAGELAFRDRSQRYLGAIVHSSPQFSGVPNERYPDAIEGPTNLYSDFVTEKSTRTPIVYVGANDGMLHAFDVGVTTTTSTSGSPPVTTTTIAANSNSGNEVFAYIPAILTIDLPQLAQPAFEFDSFVDATPTLRDVFVDADGAGTGTVDAWRTYLVGGLRNGGRSIYALDVTDPATTFANPSADAAAANAKAAEIVRFEYTHEDLGFTYSRPQIAKMNDGSWVTVVANGYNSMGDGAAKLFLIDLETGLPLTDSGILGTNVGTKAAGLSCTDSASDCNGLSAPTLVDLNGDFKVDRIYAGDLHGNIWVFNVQDTVKANWSVSKLFTATTQATPCTDCRQPITTRPDVTLHTTRRSFSTSPNILVLFGTGQFIAEGDASISDDQSFYSVWDTGTDNHSLNKNDLVARTFSGSADNLLVTGDLAAYEVGSSSNFGWYINLAGDIAPAGDPSGIKTDPFDRGRVIINPVIWGSLVFFVTTVPSGGQVCRGGETPGFLTALDLVSGKMPSFTVFTDVDGDPINSSTIALNKAAVSIAVDTGSDGSQLRTTYEDGTIGRDPIPLPNVPSGRKSWSILR
jgi:type IV pilus assembly protein PilY1